MIDYDLAEAVGRRVKRHGWGMSTNYSPRARTVHTFWAQSGRSVVYVMRDSRGRWYVESAAPPEPYGTAPAGSGHLLRADGGASAFPGHAEALAKAERFMTRNPSGPRVPVPPPKITGLPKTRKERAKVPAWSRLRKSVRVLLHEIAEREGLSVDELYEQAQVAKSDRGFSWPNAIEFAAGYIKHKKRYPHLFRGLVKVAYANPGPVQDALLPLLKQAAQDYLKPKTGK